MSRILDRRTAESIEANLGGGTPLTDAPGTPWSRADGADRTRAGDVRLHDDATSADLSRRLGAVAFTYGRDIFLSADAPELGSPAGERMLSHELTHVQQQYASGTTRPRRVSSPASPAEREAARAGDRAAPAGGPAMARTVHRQESPEEDELMTMTSETVHREVPEEEEVMTMTSEMVHREVAVDEVEAEVAGASPTTAAPTTGDSPAPAAPANPAAAALYETAVMAKLNFVAENLQGDRPDPLASHRALRDAATALEALGGAYTTSDPALHEAIMGVRNGILVVREVLSPMAGVTRDLRNDVVPMLPGMVENGAEIKARLH
jgi:hypothetical protein